MSSRKIRSRDYSHIAANKKRIETDEITAKNCEEFTIRTIKEFASENDIDITGLKTKTDICKRIKLDSGLDDTISNKGDPLMRGRPEKLHLKGSDATDFLAMIYLLRLHPDICVYNPVKSALYPESYSVAWYCDGKNIMGKTKYLIAPPSLEEQLDSCKEKFFFAILTWAPCKARSGIRTNFLLFDKRSGRMYNFDLSGYPDSETKQIFKYDELEEKLDDLADSLGYKYKSLKICSGMGDQASKCVAQTIYTATKIILREQEDDKEFEKFYKDYSTAYYELMEEVWNDSIKTQTTIQAFLIKHFNDLILVE